MDGWTVGRLGMLLGMGGGGRTAIRDGMVRDGICGVGSGRWAVRGDELEGRQGELAWVVVVTRVDMGDMRVTRVDMGWGKG